MAIKELKNAIVELATIQRATKQQRKTVNFKGIRHINAKDAAYFAREQKWELRHMYFVYNKLRGKEVPNVENNEKFSTKKITELIEKYV